MSKLYRFFDRGMNIALFFMIVFGIAALWSLVF